MRLKSYYATSVELAMQQARRELGQEALLLDTHPAPPHARHLGSCEVVFALDEASSGAPASADSPFPGIAATPNATPSHDAQALQFTTKLGALRKEMERITESVARSRSFSAVLGSILADPDLANAYAELTSADVAPDVAQELLADCARAVSRLKTTRQSDDVLQSTLSDRLRSLVKIDAGFPTPERRNPIVFVGPTGSGKTATLVKMAARCGLRSRTPMHIVSFDGLRIAASEQLRALAAILGASFQLVEEPDSLTRSVQHWQSRSWVWIDTPGAAPHEKDLTEEIATTLRKQKGLDVCLVLSATMKSADLRVAVERYSPCQPEKLIFTHVDETEHLGGLISVAAWMGRPIAFLGTGQRIPEDIEPASADRILNGVLGSVSLPNQHPQRWMAQAGGAAAGV
ncbi:MAG: hypothetical protein HY820_00195 [Acidobacteria bacterium]|nr:hypothetical protein [Acidobacteriota bacterium]